DARQREGGGSRRPAGLDRALHVPQGPHPKAALGEPAMRCGGVRDREGREVDAGITRARYLQLAAERRGRGRDMYLEMTAREHRRYVASAGRTRRVVRIGSDLNGNRRRGEARARERAARGLRIAHEMADMIEENLLEDGKLAVGHRTFPLQFR